MFVFNYKIFCQQQNYFYGGTPMTLVECRIFRTILMHVTKYPTIYD